MNRRDFLKIGGLSSIAMFVPVGSLMKKAAALPVEVVTHGMIYRGTFDGKVYTSTDAGRSWDLHTNFGSDFSVINLSINIFGQLHAQLAFSNSSFKLKLSPNGKHWQTA